MLLFQEESKGFVICSGRSSVYWDLKRTIHMIRKVYENLEPIEVYHFNEIPDHSEKYIHKNFKNVTFWSLGENYFK